MAQMPHTEAEVLAARVWEKLQNTRTKQPIDIVLSEAGETETGSDARTQKPDTTLPISPCLSLFRRRTTPFRTPDILRRF